MIDSKHSKPGSKIPPRTDVTERLGSVPPPSGETIAPGTVPPASEPPASLGRSRRVPLPPPEEPEPKRALIWGALALIALIAGGIIWFSLSPEEAEQTPVVEGTDEIAAPPAEVSEAPPGTEPSAPAPEGAGVAETETPPALEPSERAEMPAGQLLDKEVKEGETPEAPAAVTEETPEPPAATAPEVAPEEPPVEPSEPPTAPAAEEALPESPDLAATTPKAPPSPAAEEPSAPAVETPAATGAPGTYTIAPGDTLGEIATRLYGDATRWRVIARANPGLDPNRLLVGQVIKLPALPAAKQTTD
jgi:LysM repeat protein